MGEQLWPTAEPVEVTAVTLRRFAFSQAFEIQQRFTLLRQFQPLLATRLRLTIEGLGNSGGAAHFREKQNLHLKFAAIVLHLQQVAYPDLARSLDAFSMEANPAEFTGACSERTRLEEAGGPKPLIHSHPNHDPILDQARTCLSSGHQVSMASSLGLPED
jgi:hypothetical protein